MNFDIFFQSYGPILSFVLALLYFHNQNVADRQKSDDRWADLQNKWVENQKEIIVLMRRMNMIEDGQKRGQ